MGFIAPLIAGVGTGISAIGQIKAGNAAERTAEFNAQRAIEDASIRESQQREADRRILARGRALVGSSGVLLEGSPLDVLAENARQAELDALIIRRGGQLEAESQRATGRNIKSASRIGALGTILTGGYQVGKEVINLGRTRQSTASPSATSTSSGGRTKSIYRSDPYGTV